MEFTLDLQAYGIGVSLPLVGWMGGMVVSYVFNLTSILSLIGRR